MLFDFNVLRYTCHFLPNKCPILHSVSTDFLFLLSECIPYYACIGANAWGDLKLIAGGDC